MNSRHAFIKECLEQHMPMKEIAQRLNISAQRVYQLATRYGLDSPKRTKRGSWKNATVELKWLNRTLLSRGIDRSLRYSLLEHFTDNFPKECPVLGIPLVYGNDGIRKGNSASLYRLDSEKPLSLDNVAIVSWKAKTLMKDGDAADFFRIYQWKTRDLP